jgi:hypothetical protein
MKALTLCEPWAWAVCDLSALDLYHWKSVENRMEGFTVPAGRLLIHSGKGQRYRPMWAACCQRIQGATGLRPPPFDQIAGRGLIGLVQVALVTSLEMLRDHPQQAMRLCEKHGLDWSRLIHWAEGPVCVCFSRVALFERPIPWRGMPGVFDVPDARLAAAVDSAEERTAIREHGGG